MFGIFRKKYSVSIMDNKWDVIYNTETQKTVEFYEYIEPKLTPGFELIYLLALLAIFMIILRKKRKK